MMYFCIYRLVDYIWNESLTFALYGWDKHLAVYQKTRIPEFILLCFHSSEELLVLCVE